MKRTSTALRWVFAALPLLLLWPALRATVESRMSLHMLGEFPVLFTAGWCTWHLGGSAARARPWRRALALLDWQGWSSATFVSGVAAVWMLPSALDASLLSAPVAAAKLASWWLAGVWLASGGHRIQAEVLLFFAGNLAWMFATAGMLYLDTPARLCVNYLQDDQRHTGVGLVLLAFVLGALALRQALRWGAGPAAAEPLHEPSP